MKWARENYHHDLGSPYNLQLVSADAGGLIVVWDVAQGKAKTEIIDGNKPVQGNDCGVGCHTEERRKS